jgi:hypothetical protein
LQEGLLDDILSRDRIARKPKHEPMKLLRMAAHQKLETG